MMPKNSPRRTPVVSIENAGSTRPSEGVQHGVGSGVGDSGSLLRGYPGALSSLEVDVGGLTGRRAALWALFLGWCERPGVLIPRGAPRGLRKKLS